MTPHERLPYPGLRAFTREESDLFFGRDGCVDAMVNRLAVTRFLAVLGASGSGKSSLVRTGLLDALDLGLHPWAGSRWKVAEMHPGGHPTRSLAGALLGCKDGKTPDGVSVDLLAEFLRRGPRSIAEWVNGGNLATGYNLLILVDQFEELFRYGNYSRQEEAEAFSALLLETVAAQGVNVHVVVTMRSEYLGACALMPGLAEQINAGLYLTPRMTREECRQAIEEPAAVIGFDVEPALVNRLLNDLGSFAPWEPGEAADQAERLARRADQLPLMQHVLNRLWIRAGNQSGGQRAMLRLSDYDGLGGLSGALDAHGQEILAALGPGRSAVVETVFRGLVSGTSVASAVRRPGRLAELAEIAGKRDDLIEVVEAFRAPDCNFLRTSEEVLSDEAIVDISHESLIRQWTPLRGWLANEARAAAAWRRLVTAEERHAKHEGGLLAGLDLQNLVAWWDSTEPTETWARRHGGNFGAVRSFLEQGRRAEAQRQEAEKAQQERERNRLRRFVAGLGVALAIFVALGISDFRTKRKLSETNGELVKKQQDADRQRTLAESEASGTASVLDDVSNIVNKYRGQVGAGGLESELMTTLRSHEQKMLTEHPDLVGQNIARDDYRQGRAFETIGDAKNALASYAAAYEKGLADIHQQSDSQTIPESVQADFIGNGCLYAWFLSDIGEKKKAVEVIGQMRSFASRYSGTATTANLLIAYSTFENVESRYYADQHNTALRNQHSIAALNLAKRAIALPNADFSARAFAFTSYRNRSLDVSGQAKDQLIAKACQIADGLIAEKPLDASALRAKIQCLDDLAWSSRRAGKRDEAIERIGKAEEAARQGLQADPRDQSLLLLMAELENFLADMSWQQTNSAERLSQNATRFAHVMAAKDYMVRALSGRTVFQMSTSQVKDLYDNCCKQYGDEDFPDSSVRLAFYKDIAEAVSATLNAFPQTPSFAYVEASSSVQMAQAVKNDPQRATEAEAYLSKAIEWSDKGGVISDLSDFSEDFAAYCSIYNERSKLYAQQKKVDSVLRDARTIRDVCGPILKKFPWDIYLRGDIEQSAKVAGQALFDAKRYKEAQPWLEYASHWVTADSTRLLARMYREGLGLPRDERKAKELDTLAVTQHITRFTLPVDFSGVKAPFNIYVRDWPPEYPYEGIDDQAIWLKQARNAEFPKEVIESFHKLMAIAKENKTSFRDLVVYALDPATTLEEARTKLANQNSPENLEAFRQAANSIYEQDVKDKKTDEANTLQKELVDDADKLLKSMPSAPSYRVAWDIFHDQGDRLNEAGNKQEAAKAFSRSAELANLLPADNDGDLHKCIIIFEHLGDLDADAGRNDSARSWYTKEVDAAQKRFDLTPSAETLENFRLATSRLYGVDIKLQQTGQAHELDSALLRAADSLVAKAPSDPSFEQAGTAYADAAQRASSGGDSAQAQKYLLQACADAVRISTGTPDPLRERFLLLQNIADSQVSTASAAEAKHSFAQAGDSLEAYLRFRTATPPKSATGDKSSLAQLYGALSFERLLSGDFAKALDAAQQGLRLEPDAAWIEANLAHALLLTGKHDEAVTHYMKIRKGSIGSRSLVDATAEDFGILKKLGFGLPSMDDILKEMAKD